MDLAASWLLWGVTTTALARATTAAAPALGVSLYTALAASDASLVHWPTLVVVVIVCGWLATYRKSFPFAYHVRGLYAIVSRFIVAIARGRGMRTPGDAHVTRHRVLLGDLDIMLHQNNACYPAEIDVQRFGVFVDLFAGHVVYAFPLIFWGWRIANGGVATWFLIELRLHTEYEVRTRLAGIDNKWFYFRSDYVSRGDVLHAVSISRIVLKTGRKTVPPAEALARLGYAPADISALVAKGDPSEGGDVAAGPALSAVALSLAPPLEGASPTSAGGKSSGKLDPPLFLLLNKQRVSAMISILLALGFAASTAASSATVPVTKLGVYDYLTEESSPVIHNGALLMLESIPKSYENYDSAFENCSAYFRVRDMRSLNTIVNITASCGIAFGAATVLSTPGGPDTLLVTGTQWDRTHIDGRLRWTGPCEGASPVNCTVHLFASSSPQLDDASWSHHVIPVPFGIFNTDLMAVPPSMGFAHGQWLMALETISEHARFLASTSSDPRDVESWTVLDDNHTIPHLPDTGSCPSIRSDGEFIYYLTGGENIQILRSTDLLSWTESTRSVIRHADAGDCIVAPAWFGPYVPVGIAATRLATCGVGGNFGDDSDVDLVEWPAPFGDASHGPVTLLEYGSGDQKSFGFSNLALANASMSAFLQSFFA